MTALIEVQVDSIRVHMPTGQHVVILKDRGRERFLPIWIGSYEANAIALRITGITPERPITHDLMAGLIGTMNLTLNRVVVTSLASEVYYAQMLFDRSGEELDVDARPSDAIALAVRLDAPIFVAEDIFERAGVLPEDDSETDEAADDRLSVFREMINSLDLPDLDYPGRSPES